jgi:hypothetical protein
MKAYSSFRRARVRGVRELCDDRRVARGRTGIGASASRLAGIVILALLLAACASPSSRPSAAGKRPPPTTEPLRIQDFAKTDIDNVAETHLEESLAIVQNIGEKLYRRNPREWRKGPYQSPEIAIARAFDRSQAWRFSQLNDVRGTEAIHLAFRPEFAGDRVFAFTVGLASMIYEAYGGKDEFYFVDTVEPQPIYNAARNIEIAAWKLSNTRDPSGQLFLLSNDPGGDPPNLSFEREFGKLIAHQDVLARILAQRENRTLRRIVQQLPTVFLPVR